MVGHNKDNFVQVNLSTNFSLNKINLRLKWQYSYQVKEIPGRAYFSR